MSARRTAGNPKGKDVSEVNSPKAEQLNQGVADINLGFVQNNGEWKVISRKSKNCAGSSSAKQWGSQNYSSKTWTFDVQMPSMWNSGGSERAPTNFWPAQTAASIKLARRGNVRHQASARVSESNSMPPQHIVSPPLDHGWNWQSRAGFTQPKRSENAREKGEEDSNVAPGGYDDDANSDAVGDTDDELLSDDFDFDSSEKSHQTRKGSRWFKNFFQILDTLTVEEINDPARQWYCPACQGDPGAIEWYQSLQPLMKHAYMKGSKQAMLHKELAELLDEELRRRGTKVIPDGETYGMWNSLKDEEKDHEIVWPPMVAIMNTSLEQDENNKWLGMGYQELLDYFSPYAATVARHSYAPQGRCGISILIFEASARGYLEAEGLHKHFTDQGTDRDAWDHRRVLFHPGGERQLYGFMAVKEDLDIFNQHSQGESRLKFEMRSYQEMVVNQMRQMSEDNQQLMWFKNRIAKAQRHAKPLEESLGIVSHKLRRITVDNSIVRQRTKMQHAENNEEVTGAKPCSASISKLGKRESHAYKKLHGTTNLVVRLQFGTLVGVDSRLTYENGLRSYVHTDNDKKLVRISHSICATLGGDYGRGLRTVDLMRRRGFRTVREAAEFAVQILNANPILEEDEAFETFLVGCSSEEGNVCYAVKETPGAGAWQYPALVIDNLGSGGHEAEEYFRLYV